MNAEGLPSATRTVYRYLSPGSYLEDIILGHKLRFKCRTTFPDGNDCLVRFKWPPSPEEYRAMVAREVARAPGLTPAQRAAAVRLEVGRRGWQTRRHGEFKTREAQAAIDTCGILCTAETATSQYLWRHFAAAGTGVLLELLAAELAHGLVLPNGIESRYPLPVTYTEDAGEPIEANQDYEALVKRFLLSKKESFRSEEERRVVIPDLLPVGVEQYDVAFSPRLVERVVLGPRIDAELADQIVRWAASREVYLQVDRAAEDLG